MAFVSPNGPAITPVLPNSLAAIAYRGTDSFLNVVVTAAPYANYGTLYTSPSESCLYGPAIASGPGDSLYLAWKGSTNADLSLAELVLARDQAVPRVTSLNKVGGTLFSVAARGPALALYGDELMMAYTATDFSVRYLSFGNVAAGAPAPGAVTTINGSYSIGSPAICETNGRGFFVAWTDQNGALNIYSASGTGFIWNTGAAKNEQFMIIPGEQSIDGPSLAYIYDTMYIAWTDANQQVKVLRESHWQNPAAGDVKATGLSSPAAPAVTAVRALDGSIFLSVTAADVGTYNLNLTSVAGS